MPYSTRSLIAPLLAVVFATAALPGAASAAFTDTQLKCRAEVGKSGTKYVKSALKAMTGCHKSRDKDASLTGTNCNDITAADPDGKVADTAVKFDAKVVDKCTGVNPSDVLYEGCPAPCDSIAISSFGDVVDCLVCLTNGDTEGYSDAANGTPPSPPLLDADLKCHSGITKNTSKLYNSAIKSATKCQASYDENDDFTNCTGTGFAALTADAYTKCHDGVEGSCADATLPGTTLDACGGAGTAAALATCVCDEARSSAQTNAQQFVQISAPVVTTTTTSTTLPVGDPQCPRLGELTLFSHDSQIACTDNSDCDFPRTCDTSIVPTHYCTTVADLDSGWTGTAHNSDINDGVVTRAHLYCPDTDGGPGCGECDVLGIEPSPGNCRCANNVRTVCDNPFSPSAGECPACAGGVAVAGNTCSSNADCNFPTCAGRCSVNVSVTCTTNSDCTAAAAGSTCSTSSSSHRKKCANGAFCDIDADCEGSCTAHDACECFFGAPFPLNSGGTAACIVNRFAENISGTANVDLGAGDITANLRTRVYLGITQAKPCPVCGGKCSQAPTKTCVNNADCTTPAPGGTCGSYDDVLGDGIRNGTCSGGANTNQSCDASATNASFPAKSGGQLPGGGYYSIDCQPSVGLNVSGTGLVIDLEQTTGLTSLSAGVDCDGSGPGTDLCPCLQCSKDTTVPCDSDADCTGQGFFCSAYNNPVTFPCSNVDDCAAVDTGTCTGLSGTKCSNALSRSCTTNADCGFQPGGDCTLSTCASPGIGEVPKPNKCNGGVCNDIGDGFNGECATGPDQGYCDGLLRIDGRGMNTCASNTDCTATSSGLCTMSERQLCFLDPIEAQGDPDPVNPVAGSVFCVPPTENSAINGVAGLPGPGRVISQGAARTFCASNVDVEYVPGGTPACP